MFWKINNLDPHAALSFDRLHTFPGSLFRQHLWTRLHARLEEAGGREVYVQVDNMYLRLSFMFCSISLTTDNRADSVPRWRGLSHFKTYLSVEFTDGSKWEDMSKVRHD